MLETFTATFVVPTGDSAVYFQVSNVGDQDGMYGDFQVESTPVPPMDMPDAGDAGGPMAMPTNSNGCNCDTAHGQSSPVGALFGLGLVGLLAFRRRR